MLLQEAGYKSADDQLPMANPPSLFASEVLRLIASDQRPTRLPIGADAWQALLDAAQREHTALLERPPGDGLILCGRVGRRLSRRRLPPYSDVHEVRRERARQPHGRCATSATPDRGPDPGGEPHRPVLGAASGTGRLVDPRHLDGERVCWVIRSTSRPGSVRTRPRRSTGPPRSSTSPAGSACHGRTRVRLSRRRTA